MLHTARVLEAGFQGCNSKFAADSVGDHQGNRTPSFFWLCRRWVKRCVLSHTGIIQQAELDLIQPELGWNWVSHAWTLMLSTDFNLLLCWHLAFFNALGTFRYPTIQTAFFCYCLHAHFILRLHQYVFFNTAGKDCMHKWVLPMRMQDN